jgi:hypothetical protein
VTPVVTVVVPTKDRRSVLPTTLVSVAWQRDVDVRVIVVDDGSSDGTQEYLERLSARDPRFSVVHRPVPGGAAAARNAGLARVTTDWVAFCDDDDLWAPTKLARQLAAADAAGADWVACGSVMVDERDRVVYCERPGAPGDALPRLLAGNAIPGGGSGVLARTDLVRDAGAFCEELRNAEDWDCWIRLAARAPLATVDEPLLAYRVWSGSKSMAPERMERAWTQITARHADLARDRGVTPDDRRHRHVLAKKALQGGDRLGAARRYLALARRDGDRAAYLRVPAALVAPRTAARLGTRRGSRGVPQSWRDAPAAWFAELRTTTTGPVLDVA